MNIHPTVIINKSAEIDATAVIEPYCVIGENVKIGKNCRIASHVNLKQCRIGNNTTVGSFSAIGGDPQMLGWEAVPSLVVIGNDCVINEIVTVHRSKDEGSATMIGDRVMLMANTHVGHDSIIGDDVIFTTYSGTSGHVVVEDGAMLGGGCGIHQFVRIGTHAMIGGMARIAQDVVPFMLAEGNPADVRTTNAIGLKRKGFSIQARKNIKKACKALFMEGNSKQSGIEQVKAIPDAEGEIKIILGFIKKSKRGLTGI